MFRLGLLVVGLGLVLGLGSLSLSWSWFGLWSLVFSLGLLGLDPGPCLGPVS